MSFSAEVDRQIGCFAEVDLSLNQGCFSLLPSLQLVRWPRFAFELKVTLVSVSPAIRPRSRWAGLLLPIVLIVWIAAVASGFYWLELRAAVPTPPASAPHNWPDSSSLRLAADRPTLLVFLHPHCPCSRASLEGLARLLVNSPDVSVTVVCLSNAAAGTDWHQTSLWRTAARLPGVERIADRNGSEARHFGADVSGRTLLYSAEGRLLFEGGLTPARGHVGDNLGSRTLREWISTGHSQATAGPAFGCELFTPGAAEEGRPCDAR